MKTRIILYLLLITFSSCQDIFYASTTYRINKGMHRSVPLTFPNTANIVSGIERDKHVEFLFTFLGEHEYDYTVKDGGDINKLYGLTSLNIHENSARVGWRYVGEHKFEIFAYYYVDGARGFKSMGTVKTWEEITCSIDINNGYTFIVNEFFLSVAGTKNTIALRCYPYFGGDNTAPRTMLFKIKER